MRWVQGRTVIEQMLATGDLQRVPASQCPLTGFSSRLDGMFTQLRMR